MKCTACGADVKNGRCTFCGYRPTEEDMAAERAWAEEKAALSGGMGAAAKEKFKRIAKPAAPAARKPERKPAAKAGTPPPKAKPGKRDLDAAAAGYAEAKRRNEKERQARQAARRKGGAPMLAVRIFVIVWVAFAAWAVCSVLLGEYGIDIPGGIYRFLQWLLERTDGAAAAAASLP